MVNENSSQLKLLKERMSVFLKERDWEKFHTPKNISMSIAIEAAELMELFQWNNLSASEIIKDIDLMNKIKDEVADVFIYLLSLALKLDLDLYNCVEDKMVKNDQRFPPKKNLLN